jgi:CheY-like chemotaxis protein
VTKELWDVLAIDDDPETIEGLISELELDGLAVLSVGDIESAREALSTLKFGLVLVDLRMQMDPDGEVVDDAGLALIRDLRKGELGSRNIDTPYIVASAQEFRIAKLEELGFEGELDLLRRGRATTFAKGDDIRPLVKLIFSELSKA